ncbi:hypothetical protein ACLQ3D_12000 [Micromonospora vinacea]|uniref:hypothetical protein n=1 Tax=Micromonospora vinacea TaxID=709878 RepID=UPI003CF2F057
MGRRQLGMVFADDACVSYLDEVADRRARGAGSGACQVSFPVRARVGTDVVLVAYRGAVRFIAGVDDDSRADDLRWAFRLRGLTHLRRPLEMSRLRAALRRDQRRPLDDQGKLTDKASAAVLDVLLAEEPELEPVIAALFGIRDIDLPAPRKAALAEARDSIATLCAFTGAPGLLPTTGFLTEDEIDTISNRDSFLPTTHGINPREDPMVEHDANTFLGWTRRESDRLAVREFTDDNGRTLQVMNVNRWPIETRLGTDLIYYHQQRRGFVLVQYKRMVQDGPSSRCRVDDHFRQQLDVMRSLDNKCRQSEAVGDYRMVPTPSFVKICQLDTLDVDSTSMISGMCMPREQVEKYLERPDARSYLDSQTVRDYLTSTLFAQLVALGCVGTSGSATELVAREIELSLQHGKSVSVGVFSDGSGRRPSWRVPARRSSPPGRTAKRQDPQQGLLWEEPLIEQEARSRPL